MLHQRCASVLPRTGKGRPVMSLFVAGSHQLRVHAHRMVVAVPLKHAHVTMVGLVMTAVSLSALRQQTWRSVMGMDTVSDLVSVNVTKVMQD